MEKRVIKVTKKVISDGYELCERNEEGREENEGLGCDTLDRVVQSWQGGFSAEVVFDLGPEEGGG